MTALTYHYNCCVKKESLLGFLLLIAFYETHSVLLATEKRNCRRVNDWSFQSDDRNIFIGLITCVGCLTIKVGVGISLNTVEDFSFTKDSRFDEYLQNCLDLRYENE